jgi:hypothetical protein
MRFINRPVCVAITRLFYCGERGGAPTTTSSSFVFSSSPYPRPRRRGSAAFFALAPRRVSISGRKVGSVGHGCAGRPRQVLMRAQVRLATRRHRCTTLPCSTNPFPTAPTARSGPSETVKIGWDDRRHPLILSFLRISLFRASSSDGASHSGICFILR